MREIKFRAWNRKEMRYDVNINDGKPVRKGYQWFNESNDVHDSEPMQFTGLQDKNGKDIYCGDLFNHVLSTDIKGVVKFGKYTHWIDGLQIEYGYHFGFYVDFNNGRDRMDLGYWAKHSEIIGNIYENPELCKITSSNHG